MPTVVSEPLDERSAAHEPPMRPRKQSRRWRRTLAALGILIVALVGARLALPSFVRDYVQRALDQNPQYDGRIGDVSVHLWRGAYTIEDLRVVKTTGNVPVPFFAAQRVDFAIETRALLARRVVGRIVMHGPEINFVDAVDSADAQTGAGAPWLVVVRDLFPFRINSARIHDGRVHFRAFHLEPPVDVYVNQIEGSIDDLTNIHDDVTPLFATVSAKGRAMDDAVFEYQMRLDPFSYRPTFQLAVRLLGLEVTRTNALARAYGGFDFESGWFGLVIELDVREGTLEGYVKPLFRDVRVFDASDDTRKNPFRVAWELLVDAAAAFLSNPQRDQVATMIPLRGYLEDPRADLLATISNILRNAFVRAYLPRLEGVVTEIQELDLEFGSPTDPLSTR